MANAGIAAQLPIVGGDPAIFERTLAVNTLGVYYTLRAAGPHIAHPRGYALAVASLAAAVHPPLLGAYNASKAAVEALGDTLRIELYESGARVGVAYFAELDTDMTERGFGTEAAARLAQAPGALPARGAAVGRRRRDRARHRAPLAARRRAGAGSARCCPSAHAASSARSTPRRAAACSEALDDRPRRARPADHAPADRREGARAVSAPRSGGGLGERSRRARATRVERSRRGAPPSPGARLAAPATAADQAQVVASRQHRRSPARADGAHGPRSPPTPRCACCCRAATRSDTARRYPVLYLLHGASGNYANWTLLGDAERTTAGQPLIVVMPDGGRGGWYSDWYNGGQGGRPEWERYHVDQLIPLVDRRFRTVAARRGRAIAGLSMGGFGALSYAARHPDLFTYAASFSGGVDLNAKVGGVPTGQGRRRRDGLPGRRHRGLDLRRLRDPTTSAGAATTRATSRANLRGLGLALYTGNGAPGGPLGGSTLDIIELGAHQMSVNVHSRLTKLGIPHLWDDYGPGAHTWPYWARDLREVLPSLMDALRAGARDSGPRHLHVDRALLRGLRLARGRAPPERRVQLPARRVARAVSRSPAAGGRR